MAEWVHSCQGPAQSPESTLRPAPHRQAPRGPGPEEILDRNATTTARLKGAARIERGGTAESQEWSEARRFPVKIVVEEREPALRTAKE